MKSKINILIAGGDMRQIFCADKLAEEYNVCTTGFNSDFTHESTLQNDFFDCLVLPVPPLDEKGNINTPCSESEISLTDLSKYLKKDCLIFTGRSDKRLDEFFPENEIIDYMNLEELTLKNAIPTAEGAVQIALDELPVTLNGLPVLIIGMGRIGTALAEILKGFGADITVSVHNAKGSAKARIHGIKSICTKDMDTKYKLVFNTVPKLIFTHELLEKFDSNTLFIDLASRPGGFDFEAAAELGKKVIWALGLPGKTAPVTAGEFVAESVSYILTERSENNE